MVDTNIAILKFLWKVLYIYAFLGIPQVFPWYSLSNLQSQRHNSDPLAAGLNVHWANSQMKAKLARDSKSFPRASPQGYETQETKKTKSSKLGLDEIVGFTGLE